MHEALKKKLGKYLVHPEFLDENTPELPALDPRFPNNHVYFNAADPAGPRYQSITTVLDAMGVAKPLMHWANSLGFRRIQYEVELQKSSEAGTALHAGAQHLVDPKAAPKLPKLKDPLMDYYMRKRLDCLKMRLDLEKPWKTIFTETTLFSKKYEIAGTIDWFCEFREHPTIADFKSASGMREKFLYQLGGYGLLMDENGIYYERVAIFLCKEDNCIIHMFPREVVDEAKAFFLLVKQYGFNYEKVTDWIRDRQYLLDLPTRS